MTVKPEEASRNTRNSNELGTLVANHISAMLAYWDKDQVCRFANNAYSEWFGKSSAEMMDKITLKELLGPLYEKNLPFIEQAYKGIPQQFDREIKVPNGEIRHSIANYYPDILNGQVIGVFVHVADITSIKKLERERTASEKKFKGLLESAPDALVIIDHTGTIEIVNVQTEKLFGYTRQELIGQPIEILIPSRFRNAHADRRSGFFAKPAAREMGAGLELFALKKDGTELPVEISISPIELEDGVYVSAAIRDITHRKRAEAELKKANRELKAIFDAGAQVSIIGTNTSGIITHFNKGAESLLGYTAEEMVGKQTPVILHKKSEIDALIRATGKEAFEGLVANARAGRPDSKELTYVRKDGTTFPAQLHVQAITDDANLTTGFLGIAMDLTERKRAEEGIRKYAELEAKNKEMSQFAYVASHDLQEPLRTVTSFAELLKKKYGDKLDKEGDLYLHYMLSSAQRMMELIKGLLEYSLIGKERSLLQVDCNEIIKAVIHDLDTKINDAHAIVEVGPLPVINGYKLELHVLFQNLVSNAIKFRRKGVVPVIKISAEKNEAGWLFKVADNGIGIEDKTKERIFIIFNRLHNRSEYSGNGIGLAHCKKIVELHNGDLWVESVYGEGSTFCFTLNA